MLFLYVFVFYMKLYTPMRSSSLNVYAQLFAVTLISIPTDKKFIIYLLFLIHSRYSFLCLIINYYLLKSNLLY